MHDALEELRLLRAFHCAYREYLSVSADMDIDFDATLTAENKMLDALDALDNFYRAA